MPVSGWAANMKYYQLCSGSKGNCTIIETGGTRIIIDCGAPTKNYLKDAFHLVGINPADADALLITHNHTDHIRYLKMFYGIKTFSPFPLEDREVIPVIPHQLFKIGNLQVFPIVLSHDAPITIGYIFFDGTEKLVYITDTGYLKKEYYRFIQNADIYIIECNHDIETLMATNRPYMLKRRILSDEGHLNNEDCADILKCCIGEKTKDIVLAHISEEANTPELAMSAVCKQITDPKIHIVVANQRQITEGGR